VAVIVEQGGHGGSIAAPAGRTYWQPFSIRSSPRSNDGRLTMRPVDKSRTGRLLTAINVPLVVATLLLTAYGTLIVSRPPWPRAR
jgi:hypothetical protein